MAEVAALRRFPENQRLLKLRSGTEVWAQTQHLGEGQISLNLEIFPPHPAPPDESQLQGLFRGLVQLASNMGWNEPTLKNLGRPTDIFFPSVPEGALHVVKQNISEALEAQR